MTDLDGLYINNRIDATLAPFAQKNADSKGRKYSAEGDPERTPFQRDRDRILHSSAFRRLKGKMQVVPPNYGDHYRTRLTHTLEVASISRDIARTLELNEDLAEAIALAHDLGHPPFGHSGERALDKCLRPFGIRFEHNEQSLRVVESFAQDYAGHNGLNLTLETLEGLKKHATVPPTMEAQLVDLADEIAYIAADLEDGLRGQYFTKKAVIEEPLLQAAMLHSNGKMGRGAQSRAVVRHLLRALVASIRMNTAQMKIKSALDIRTKKTRVVQFTKAIERQFMSLKRFLMRNYYMHPDISKWTNKGILVVQELFAYFLDHPEMLPEHLNAEELPRRIADYIAGMTDAFALELHQQYCTNNE